MLSKPISVRLTVVRAKDRRAAARPWAENSSGRRAEDALRQVLADVEQALRDAEARLAEIEGRQSA